MPTRKILRVGTVSATALLLSACAKPVIVEQTPCSVELACIALICGSAQAVADAAQAHCQQYGLDAQSSGVRTSATGNRIEDFNCVNNRGPAAAATLSR
jgi:hypothetical protein